MNGDVGVIFFQEYNGLGSICLAPNNLLAWVLRTCSSLTELQKRFQKIEQATLIGMQ